MSKEEKTTDEKIAKIVQFALTTRDAKTLFKLSEMFKKWAEYEQDLAELLKSK
jgi:hypothetical protein